MSQTPAFSRRPKARRPVVLAFLLALAGADLAVADDDKVMPAVRGVGIFRLDSREEALKGEAERVSISKLGELELAPDLALTAELQEPFVLSAARAPAGLLVGTGAEGKLLLVKAGGEVETLGQAPEGQIFAVLARRDGSLLAAASPSGKVYKVAKGPDGASTLEPFFEPGQTYIWAMAEDAEGRLLVATGGAGRVYRVGKDGKGEVLYEGADPHVRTLLVEPDGALVFGTVGQGLLLRRREGKTPSLETLHDSPLPEVLGLTRGPDGTLYAAFLASEASQVELEKLDPNAESPATVGTRATGASGPRSIVMAIDPRGHAKPLFDVADETVHSLLWHEGSLWVGTGQEGRLYRWTGDLLIREAVLAQRQIVALAAETLGGGKDAAGKGGGFAPLWLATTDGAAVHRIQGARAAEGVFTSMVLDAGQVARFGRLRFEAETPQGSRVRWALRSGMSATPDASWSPWRDLEADDAGGAPAAIGPGQFVQVRATLQRGAAAGPGPRVALVELSYRQDNVAPALESLEVLPPGQILVPAGFNPATTTFEPWSPNKEGIFASLKAEASDDGRLKALYKQGFRTLRWTAKDANQDALRYRLSVRPETSEAKGDGWLTMVEDLDQDHYDFDARVLPDGAYRFRLEVNDGFERSEGDALEAERVSERVVIDHGPPRLVESRERSGSWEVRLEDAWNPLLRVELSVDGGPWRLLDAADGLLDGRQETLRFARPAGARYLLLRVTDAAFNVVTFPVAQP